MKDSYERRREIMHIMSAKEMDNRDFGLIIIDWDRPLLPEQDDEYRTISGRDGREHFSKELGNKEIRVRFLKHNDNVKQWMSDRKEIVKWLYSKDEIWFTFDDEPATFYIGKVTNVDLPVNYKPDVSFWITITVHPFTYRLAIDAFLSFSDGVATVENIGNYDTPYILSVTSGSSVSGYRFSMNGAELTYDGQVNMGDVITIDTEEMEFRLNGNLKVLEVDGYFTFLESGSNTVTSNVTGEHRIKYTERNL